MPAERWAAALSPICCLNSWAELTSAAIRHDWGSRMRAAKSSLMTQLIRAMSANCRSFNGLLRCAAYCSIPAVTMTTVALAKLSVSCAGPLVMNGSARERRNVSRGARRSREFNAPFQRAAMAGGGTKILTRRPFAISFDGVPCAPRHSWPRTRSRLSEPELRPASHRCNCETVPQNRPVPVLR